MESLPQELLINEIVPKLTPSSLCVLVSTCRYIERLTDNPTIWTAYLASYDYRSLQSLLLRAGEARNIKIIKNVLLSDRVTMVDQRTIELLYYWSAVKDDEELTTFLRERFNFVRNINQSTRSRFGEYEIIQRGDPLLPISYVRYIVDTTAKVRKIMNLSSPTNREIVNLCNTLRSVELYSNLQSFWAPNIDLFTGILITRNLTPQTAQCLLWETMVEEWNRKDYYSVAQHADRIVAGLLYHNNVEVIGLICGQIDDGGGSTPNPFALYVNHLFRDSSLEMFKKLDIDSRRYELSLVNEREIWWRRWNRSFSDDRDGETTRKKMVATIYRTLSPSEALQCIKDSVEKKDPFQVQMEQMMTRGLDLYSSKRDMDYRVFTIVSTALKEGYSYWAEEMFRLYSQQ